MKQPWVYMWGTHVHMVFNENHLPAAWTAVSLNSAYKNPGGATIFKCNFTAERPGSAVVLYECLIIHSCHRLTGAAIFLPAIGTDLRRVVISQWAATAMAISRQHCNLKMLFSTELKKKSPRNYFCELYWSVRWCHWKGGVSASSQTVQFETLSGLHVVIKGQKIFNNFKSLL